MRCYNLATARQNLDRVTALILDAQNLEQIPVEVWQMPRLETLDLRHNALKVLPENLAALSALKTLWLAHNQLEKLPIQLPNLLQIDLSKNRFSHFPVALRQLKELQSLNLSSNRLREWPELNFPALKHLTLSTNKIGEGCFAAALLPKLEKLDLAHNRLTQVSFQGVFTTLQSLNLARNQLRFLPDNWDKMPFLRQLNLAQNQLEQLPATLNACAWLKTLHVNKNKLQRLGRYFSAFQRLEELDLADNVLNQVPDLPAGLRKINLAGNQLAEVPTTLFQHPALRQLDLSYNPLFKLEGLGKGNQLQQLVIRGLPTAGLEHEVLAFSPSIALKVSSQDEEWTKLLNFLRASQRKGLSISDRRKLWAAQQQKAPLAALPLELVMRGMNLGIPHFQQVLREHLLKERSFKTEIQGGDNLALIGRSTQSKQDLQVRLEQKGIRLVKPEQSRFWILAKAPYPENLPTVLDVCWLDERGLEQLLSAAQPTFDAHEQENLLQLLLHPEPQHVQLAVQIMNHHGMPLAILPQLYVVWRRTSGDKLRRELRALLERYWPSDKRKLLRVREKISPNLSQEELAAKLAEITRLLNGE